MKNEISISDGSIQVILYPENQREHSELEKLMNQKPEITEMSSHLKRHEDNEDGEVFRFSGGNLSKHFILETEFFDHPSFKSTEYGYPI